MHVLILNQTFHPDTAATAQLMWDVAEHLSSHGHRVSAVTSRMFYGTDRLHDLPFERIGNIEIHRLGGTRFGKRHLLGRLADFVSFFIGAGWHLQHTSPPDVILALTSPPMVSSLALLQRRTRLTTDGRRIKFVYHLMDLYPDAAVESGVIRRRSPVDHVLRHLTSVTLGSADMVIALGRDMRDRLLERYPKHARRDRIAIIPPWADGRLLFPLPRGENSLAGKLELGDAFTIVYSGNLGIAHDLDTIVAAIRAMRDDANTLWLFIGGGKRFDILHKQAMTEAWTHVRFLPFQDRAGLNQSLNLADVHLVSQHPAFTGVVVPSKLFGILAVGKPSVMIGPAEVECSRILSENQAGIVVSNGDSEALVRSLRLLRNDPAKANLMGRQARIAFERSYDREVACQRIEDLLLAVVNEQ